MCDPRPSLPALPTPPLPAEPAHRYADSTRPPPPGQSSTLSSTYVTGEDQAAVDAIAALVAQDLDAA